MTGGVAEGGNRHARSFDFPDGDVRRRPDPGIRALSGVPGLPAAPRARTAAGQAYIDPVGMTARYGSSGASSTGIRRASTAIAAGWRHWSSSAGTRMQSSTACISTLSWCRRIRTPSGRSWRGTPVDWRHHPATSWPSLVRPPARWWFFDYPAAIHLASRLLEVRPDDRVGNLFRGSSRLLHHVQTTRGIADLEQGIALDPDNPSVHFIASDAYTYGLSDPHRALAEATIALDGGLDTPRVHALLGAAYNALGETLTAASHIKRHLDLVTTEPAAGVRARAGRRAVARPRPGEDLRDRGPGGGRPADRDHHRQPCLLGHDRRAARPRRDPVIGSDDDSGYFAAFDWVAERSVTYRLRVSFFDSVATGLLEVSRDRRSGLMASRAGQPRSALGRLELARVRERPPAARRARGRHRLAVDPAIASSTQHTTRSPGRPPQRRLHRRHLLEDLLGTAVLAVPAAFAARTPSITLLAVSPGARPRRFLSSRTMISSNAPAAIAPYSRWSSSRRSPGMPSTPIARPDRVPVAAAPNAGRCVWAPRPSSG